MKVHIYGHKEISSLQSLEKNKFSIAFYFPFHKILEQKITRKTHSQHNSNMILENPFLSYLGLIPQRNCLFFSLENKTGIRLSPFPHRNKWSWLISAWFKSNPLVLENFEVIQFSRYNVKMADKVKGHMKNGSFDKFGWAMWRVKIKTKVSNIASLSQL